MKPTILVTGATGTVGAGLLKELLPDQQAGSLRLVAVTRSATAREAFREQGIASVAMDFSDRAGVAAATKGIDRLFLCTGYTVDMLEHSKVLLDAAVQAGVTQVVHLGALAPAGAGDLPHFVWHDYVEAYIERQPWLWCHLRPRSFMQNALASLRGTVLRHFSGDARIEWIDAEDIARVAAAALRDPQLHHRRAYPLAEEALTMAEVANVLARHSGLTFTAEARDPVSQLPALLKSGMDPVYAASLARATQRVASSDARSAATFDSVLQVTGRPGARWDDFAARHLTQLRSRPPREPQAAGTQEIS